MLKYMSDSLCNIHTKVYVCCINIHSSGPPSETVDEPRQPRVFNPSTSTSHGSNVMPAMWCIAIKNLSLDRREGENIREAG